MIFNEGNISSPSPAANNEDLNLKKIYINQCLGHAEISSN